MDTDTPLRQLALDYHALPRPGKLETKISKATVNAQDLTLAYSPGVGYPVQEIAKDPWAAYKYTAKGNLVGVISNGSAILGLGDLGALASKPVMEGKAVLFKKFADIDVFDIEIDVSNPGDFVETVARIAPTFGGINLEDIKAPECFYIEEQLQERLNIPVFHDDQHGTAVVVVAALLNALELQQKNIQDINIVCLGAGAAGIATMKLLKKVGVKKEHIYMFDRNGLIHSERDDLNSYKKDFANQTSLRSLEEVLKIADVFIGVSGPNLLSADNLKLMPPNPIIFALSNPFPEIRPELALATRSDIIIATGRSDYPNQVNNVLCFPYLFRGALDAKALVINEAMLLAAVEGLRAIVRDGAMEKVLSKNYILPSPFDVRLKEVIPAYVKKAAEESGVTRDR